MKEEERNVISPLDLFKLDQRSWMSFFHADNSLVDSALDEGIWFLLAAQFL